MGRKEEALLVWEKGYEHALQQTADLKQLLELEELLAAAKQDRSITCENCVTDSRSSLTISESGVYLNGKISGTSENHNKSDSSNSSSDSMDASETCSKSNNNFSLCNEISDKARGSSSTPLSESGLHENGNSSEASENLNDESRDASKDASKIYKKSDDSFDTGNGSIDKAGVNKMHGSQMNGTHGIHDKLSSDSESFKDKSRTSESCSKSSVSVSEPGDGTEVCIKLSGNSDVRKETGDGAKKSKKFCVTRISKTKSISVDFRLSRGIAQVSFGTWLWHQ